MATKSKRGDVLAPWGHLGCFVGVWCGHGVLWWPTSRGLSRVLLLWRGPAVASLGPLWSPWGNPRPLQWPPDPQGPWQRPPVGWGWCGAAIKNKRPLRVGIAAFTCPTHGPIPPPTHRRPLLGSLRVGWPLQGRGLPRGNHNGPKEAIASTRHKKSALPRPRPVGHQSTPWPHQTPTKHPRGPAHHPARLWWPWAASGVAIWSENSPVSLFCAFSFQLGVAQVLTSKAAPDSYGTSMARASARTKQSPSRTYSGIKHISGCGIRLALIQIRAAPR